MNKEEVFLKKIAETLDNSSFLGDDCAYLEEYNLAISTDTLVEDIHFKLGQKNGAISPYALGKKALLVNISDILASGAKPEYLTISLSGNLDADFVENFYTGINNVCRKYDLKVIGGDLTGGSKVSVSITIFGNTKGRTVSSRAKAKEGYIVLLAGEHGSSATGFKILSGKLNINEAENKHFINAHIEPKLYPKISETIALNCKKPYAMMDTSDGLYDALKKISESSKTGFSIDFDKIPKKSVQYKDNTTIPDFNTVFFGGEDYGLLICISKDDFSAFGEKLISLGAAKIGTVTKEKILINGKEIDKDLRFEHFG